MTQFSKGRALLACAVLGLSVSATANEVCNPTSVGTCALPFPSNYWSNEDANSPTGLRLSISDDVISQEILAELPVQDGFSPAGLFKTIKCESSNRISSAIFSAFGTASTGGGKISA